MNEFELGIICGELYSTGNIQDSTSRTVLIDTISRMADLVEQNYEFGESGNPLKDENIVKLFNLITDGFELEQHDLDTIEIVLCDLFDKLNEGDLDDCFGTSGWKEIIW